MFTLSYKKQKFIYRFPEIVDPENKKVSLYILNKLEPFMKFNKTENSLTIVASEEGEYRIQTKLTNELGLSKVDQLFIKIEQS